MAPLVEVAASVPEAYYSSGLHARYKLDGIQPDSVTNRDYSAAKGFSQQPSSIGYETNEAQYRDREHRRLIEGQLETTLPPGFVPQLQGPLVWTGNDFEGGEESFIYLLDAQDKHEIQAALLHFKEKELDGDQVDVFNFPLPNLSHRLEQIKDDIYHGMGFAIIRDSADKNRSTSA